MGGTTSGQVALGCVRKLARPEPVSELGSNTSPWVLRDSLPRLLPSVMDCDLKASALSSPCCFWSERLITAAAKQTASNRALTSDTKQVLRKAPSPDL